MKCINCSWIGEDVNGKFCPVCGDNVISSIVKVEAPKVEEPKVDIDLNGDGVVDKKDKSIAVKMFATKKKKK